MAEYFHNDACNARLLSVIIPCKGNGQADLLAYRLGLFFDFSQLRQGIPVIGIDAQDRIPFPDSLSHTVLTGIQDS